MIDITSIPAVLLYDPLLNNEDFILGAGGGDTRIFIGATLELLLIIANIGTAVVPCSLFKRYNERLAVGFVTARLVECGFIAVGIVSVLGVVQRLRCPPCSGARRRPTIHSPISACQCRRSRPSPRTRRLCSSAGGQICGGLGSGVAGSGGPGGWGVGSGAGCGSPGTGGVGVGGDGSGPGGPGIGPGTGFGIVIGLVGH
jgi:hypothetical protein